MVCYTAELLASCAKLPELPVCRIDVVYVCWPAELLASCADCGAHSGCLCARVQAKVVAVRVLDCNGTGNISDTLAGLDWVASSYKQPAVISMSLGMPAGNWSR